MTYDIDPREEFEVFIKVRYSLPGNLELREVLYGSRDPLECIKLDFANDQVAFMCEFASSIAEVDHIMPIPRGTAK